MEQTEEEPRYDVVKLWGSPSRYELMVTVCYFLSSGELRLTKQALIRSASILSMQHTDSWEGQGNRAALRSDYFPMAPKSLAELTNTHYQLVLRWCRVAHPTLNSS